MNALLATGEVPGLFEGDEKVTLISACREAATLTRDLADEIDNISSNVQLLDKEPNDDELYRMFIKSVQKNLHVVFTLNSASAEDWKGHCMASPALFNRCIVDWFGTWSDKSLCQIAYELIKDIDIGWTTLETSSIAMKNSALFDVVALSLDLKNEKDDNHGEIGPRFKWALVAALCHIHKTVKLTSDIPRQRGWTRYVLSPRDFIDFINKFISLVEEKRSELEDEQQHLNVGLERFRLTQETIANMKLSLAAKDMELKDKKNAANCKLSLMIDKQSEAEKEKENQQMLSRKLVQKNDEIEKRKKAAEADLAKAEPALLAAKEAVRGIKKTQLEEVRTLRKPPLLVAHTMETVCCIIGRTSDSDISWDDIRRVIRSDDFIRSVQDFDESYLTRNRVAHIKEKYMSGEYSNVTADAVYNSSRACGPLWQVRRLSAKSALFCTLMSVIE